MSKEIAVAGTKENAMKITLSPIASTKTTTVSISGLTVTIDGTDYDLSVIPENGQAEAAVGSPFIGTVTRDAITIRYEYDTTTAEPDQSTDWSDYIFFVESGDPLVGKTNFRLGIGVDFSDVWHILSVFEE